MKNLVRSLNGSQLINQKGSLTLKPAARRLRRQSTARLAVQTGAQWPPSLPSLCRPRARSTGEATGSHQPFHRARQEQHSTSSPFTNYTEKAPKQRYYCTERGTWSTRRTVISKTGPPSCSLTGVGLCPVSLPKAQE